MSTVRYVASLIVLMAQTVLMAATPISFDAPRDYIAGAVSVAVGDFNSDGKADVIAASLKIRLLLGNGDASLQTAVEVLSGSAPFRGLAVGDFNNDGKADVAAAQSDSPGQVMVLLGNGDASFQPAVSYLVGGAPVALVMADLNGDRAADLATANSSSGGASVLLGNADGTFQAATLVDVGSRPTSLVVDDFNGDAKLDLAATNFWSQRVSTAFGNGNGTFQPATSFVVDFPPFVGVTVDFNADLKRDLMLLGPAGRAVSYYSGNGDGTFTPEGNLGAGDNEPRSAIVADFNGDARPDVAMSFYPWTPVTTSLIVVELGGDAPGNWVFSTVREKPYALAAADFDGDSTLDLVVGGVDYSIVGVVRGTGDGHFTTMKTIGEGTVFAEGDVNNDGKRDLVGHRGVRLGNGDGSFQPQIEYLGTLSISLATVADVNGDRNTDLVAVEGSSTSDRILVLLGNGDGIFSSPAFYTSGPAPRSIAVGDFDGDAKLDLAVANAGYLPCLCPRQRGSTAILLGRGDGTFQAPTLLTDVYFPERIVTGDFNGDLRPDLAVANGRDEPGQRAVTMFLNKGGGTFTTVFLPATWAPYSLAAGDFNGDNRTDLAVKVIAQEPCRNAVAIILGSGDGSFRMSQAFGVFGSCGFGHPVVADFDGNGVVDLAVPNSVTGLLEVRSGNGDGTFEPAAFFNVTGMHRFAADQFVIAADFNSDSKPDLVTWGSEHMIDGGVPTIKLLTNTTLWPALKER